MKGSEQSSTLYSFCFFVSVICLDELLFLKRRDSWVEGDGLRRRKVWHCTSSGVKVHLSRHSRHNTISARNSKEARFSHLLASGVIWVPVLLCLLLINIPNPAQARPTFSARANIWVLWVTTSYTEEQLHCFAGYHYFTTYYPYTPSSLSSVMTVTGVIFIMYATQWTWVEGGKASCFFTFYSFINRFSLLLRLQVKKESGKVEKLPELIFNQKGIVKWKAAFWQI